MPLSPSDITSAQDLLRRRAQLRSRQDRINACATLGEMAALFDGTGLEARVLELSKAQMGMFFVTVVGEIEAQLAGLGVVIPNE